MFTVNDDQMWSGGEGIPKVRVVMDLLWWSCSSGRRIGYLYNSVKD